MALIGRLLRSSPDPARASFLVDVHVLSADEGGRREPLFRGYRPQVDIGQRRTDGSRIDWRCMWSFDGLVRPGENVRVAVRLDTLPDEVLSEAETVSFYEGDRLIATGSVVAIVPDGAHLFPPVED